MRPVDPEKDMPLYYQVKEALRERMATECWKPGTRLPSEQELAASFGVSTITVRQAVLELVREGLLYRKQGRGTFVATPKIEGDFIQLFFPEELSNEHRNISIDRITPTSSVSQALETRADEPVLRLVRVRLFNGEPAVLERSFIRESLCPCLLADPPAGRLYSYLAERSGIHLDYAETRVEPIVMGGYESRILGVKKGTPALLLTRRNFSGDKPIVLSESIVRGDRCRLLLRSGKKEGSGQ